MLKKCFVVSVFILCFVFAPKLKAQDITKKGEVPKDLIISINVKSTNRAPEPSYTITLNGDGNWVFNSKDAISKKEAAKRGKTEKSQIEELVLEFEKIDFFNLNDTYSYSETNKMPCINHRNIEIISIEFDGKLKQISNYLGCFGTVQNSLANLGKRIRKITIGDTEIK